MTATGKNNLAGVFSTAGDLIIKGSSLSAMGGNRAVHLIDENGKVELECAIVTSGKPTDETYQVTVNHTEVADPAVAATCTTPGKTQGKHCSACGAVIQAQTETPALGHDWAGSLSHDASDHWYTCNRCDAQKDSTVHTWDGGVIDPAPTCTGEGVKTYTCTVCKAEIGTKTIPALGHSYTYTAEGGTITQTCGNDPTHTHTLTIAASGGAYDGTQRTADVTHNDLDNAAVSGIT